jgi:spermidine dehydrogenase
MGAGSGSGRNTGARPRAARPPGAARRIPRRDFLQGALLAAGTTLSGALLRAVAAEDAGEPPTDYPPALQGMRGAHAGSFEAAHALRDGAGVPQAPLAQESYDLIVVGAGISGLAAAHFYRAAAAGRRILILDNHDDFGGHAKRNEFVLEGRLHLVNGGTLDIDSPRPYSAVASALLRELGIDAAPLARRIEQRRYYAQHGLRSGIFFDAETFGSDKLLPGWRSQPLQQLLQAAPLSARARADLARLETAHVDYLPTLTEAQKKDRLARMSYLEFLRDLVKLDAQALQVCQRLTHGEWGVGIDAVSALDLWGYGYAGFQGLKLSRRATPYMGATAAGYLETGGSAHCHLPDGNATIARLLVRKLIPGVAPGATVEDVVSARFDYQRLDTPSEAVRLRLNSTAVQVRRLGEARDGGVEVVYLNGGVAHAVRARHCVLACWNMMIPYLCPQLPAAQQQALRALVKAPLVYANVGLRSWRAFQRLGVSEVYAPGAYFSNLYLNPVVNIGAYRAATDPEQPTVLRLERTPCRPGLSEHEQNRLGRAELLTTSFATFEGQIRAQLARLLGAGGFDAERDIVGITVNRWPHGYASEFNSLFDPWLPAHERPEVLGRRPFGPIAIANSDAGAAAYTDAAIDQAHRAVHELLQG